MLTSTFLFVRTICFVVWPFCLNLFTLLIDQIKGNNYNNKNVPEPMRTSITKRKEFAIQNGVPWCCSEVILIYQVTIYKIKLENGACMEVQTWTCFLGGRNYFGINYRIKSLEVRTFCEVLAWRQELIGSIVQYKSCGGIEMPLNFEFCYWMTLFISIPLHLITIHS